jgi:hypothetical protein
LSSFIDPVTAAGGGTLSAASQAVQAGELAIRVGPLCAALKPMPERLARRTIAGENAPSDYRELQKETTMRHTPTFVIQSGCILIGLAGAAMLAGCSQGSQSPAPTATVASSTVDDREQQLKQKEEELARREAEVAAKEREQAVAQREAEVAAQEKEVARQKQELEAAAAAAKKSASKSAAKSATHAKALAASGASTPTRVASAEPKPFTPPPPERLEVPSGTVLTLALSDELTSKTAQPGDTLVATVASNLMVNGKVALPIGTRVTGTVTDVISGSRSIGAIPTIGVRFNQLELEGGQTVPITGDLVEEGKSERGQDTAKILGGVAAGAVLGHQVKTNNRGKVIGGLLGGAIGAVAAKKTGSEVTLPAGSTVTITTGEPFTVTVPARTN